MGGACNTATRWLVTQKKPIYWKKKKAGKFGVGYFNMGGGK